MAAALLGALYGSPVIAADTPLTLPEAQRLAIARSGQLAAQQYAVTAAREMAVAAGQLPDPVATLGVNNLPINGPDAWSFTRDFMTMTSVGVMQEFTRAEKRAARAERFDREANKALAEKDARVAMIQRDTALAWLDRYYAEAMQAVIAEQKGQAEIEIIARGEAILPTFSPRATRWCCSTIAGAKSGARQVPPGLPWRAGSATTRTRRWPGSPRSTRFASIPARSKRISPTTQRLPCSPGRKRLRPPRFAWRRRIRKPTGASR